jgi:hypothetical protein
MVARMLRQSCVALVGAVITHNGDVKHARIHEVLERTGAEALK